MDGNDTDTTQFIILHISAHFHCYNKHRDLDDKNQFIQAMALTTIANIASADICRDLSHEVEKLFIDAPSYIRKKAAICGMRMVRKCPDELTDNYVEKLDIVLTNEQHQRNHGAMITCIALVMEICRIRNEQLRRLVVACLFSVWLLPYLLLLLLSLVTETNDLLNSQFFCQCLCVPTN